MVNLYKATITCLLLFLLITTKSSFAQTTQDSDQFTVTVTVALSNLWRETISENSRAHVKEKKSINEESSVELQVIGLDNNIMDKQLITAQIFKNGDLDKEVENITNNNGLVEFKFVPKDRGFYSVNFTNKTYEYPFTLNSQINLLYL